MADAPTDQEIHQWHRRFAVETNNRAWRLSESAARTAADDAGLHLQHYAIAKEMGAALAHPEERGIFEATLRRIPQPSTTAHGAHCAHRR